MARKSSRCGRHDILQTSIHAKLLSTLSVYLVYAWAAHGMMGLGREDALQSLQVTRLSGSYADLVTVYSGMNIAAQFASGDASDIEAFAYTLDLRS